jgi:hypothetical protein
MTGRGVSTGGRRRSLPWIAFSAAALAAVVAATAFGAALTAGRTNAPDAVSAAFRAGSDAHHAAVDVHWDSAATADSGGSGSASLITLDGHKVECLTPSTGSAGKSGGTSAGGNGTTTWTMSCGPISGGKYANQRPSKSNIARVMVLGDTATDATHSLFNGLEQINVAGGGLTTDRPDLKSAKFSTGVKGPSGNTVDEAVYTFTKAITLLKNPGAFGVTPVEGGDASTIATSNGPFPGDHPVVSGHTVKVFYAAGTLKLATQAYVDQEAVEAAGGVLGLEGQVGALAGGGTAPPPPPPGPTQPPVGPTPTPTTLPPLPAPKGAVTINNGAKGTKKKTVHLTFPHPPAGATKVEVSNHKNMSGHKTFAYKKGLRVAWTLPVMKNGTRHTVYVRFVLAKGKSGVFHHSIVEDTTAPSFTHVAAPHYVGGTTAVGDPPPLYLGWKAGTDKGSHVASYVVHASIAGGAWKLVARTRGHFAYVHVAAGKAYRFRVAAIDGAGNESKRVTTGSVSLALTPAANAAIKYTGVWTTEGKLRKGAAGSSLSFSFTGRMLAWIAPTASTYGSAQITIDGKAHGAVTLYEAKDPGRIIHVWSWPKSGAHTLHIKAGTLPIAVESFVSVK